MSQNRWLNSLKKEWVVISLLFFSFILFVHLALESEGSYGGADAFLHYAMSRYLWSYPEGLLINHWGKPLFILLSNPFAQWGYLGIQVFNILCGVFAAWFSYTTAKKVGATRPEVAPLFVLFGSLGVPVYLSGLTEPLFALVLALALHFFTHQKYLLSALVISFIVISRSEGLVIIVLFGLALAALKQWKVLPYLLTGLVFISVLNLIVEGDFFGYLSQMPFGNGFYGKGEMGHFLNYRDQIFGVPFQIMIFCGFLLLVLNWPIFKSFYPYSVNLLLITAVFIGYFAAHSYVWWAGSGSSAGLIRVMVGIFPAAAIIAAVGTHYFSTLKRWFKWDATWVPVLIVVFYQVQEPFKYQAVPTQWGVEEQELIKAVNYLDSAYMHQPYVGYFNPTAPHLLEVDPFDSTLNVQVYKHTRSLWNKPGTVILFDNHFATGEAGFSQVFFESDSTYKKLKTFQTNTAHKGNDGKPFKVILYEKQALD